MEEIKLPQEEIDNLKSLQTLQSTLINNFGNLEYQIQVLELQKEKLINQLESLQNKETQISEELNERYGNGNINLDTGVFTKT